MEVRLTVDANEMKRNIHTLIEKKAGKVTSSSEVRILLLEKLAKQMQTYSMFPEDSGAMKQGDGPHLSQNTTWIDGKGRVHNRTLYERFGRYDYASHAGKTELIIDPIERRPYDDIHYASWHEETLNEIAQSAAQDYEFLEYAQSVIAKKMEE